MEERGALAPWAAQEAAASFGGGPSAYLHAFRRVWLPATLAGVFLAAIAGAAVWLTQSPTYTATSIIRVAPTEQQIADWNQRSFNQEDYEAFKGTQPEIIKSRFVLTAALRPPKDPTEIAVANLPMIHGESDQVAFLQQNLSVSLPRNTEVMLVSLKGEDKKSVVSLVKAVVDAYIYEVVDRDTQRRVQRLNVLRTVYTEREDVLRRKKSELQDLVKTLGVSEPQALTTKQQLLLQNLGEVRRQLLQVQWEMAKIQGEISSYKVLLKAAGEDSKLQVSQVEVLAALRGDPTYQQLLQSVAQINLERTLTESVAPDSPLGARYTKRNEDLQKAMQKQLAARRDELRDELYKEMKASTAARADIEMKRLGSQLSSLTEQEKELKKNLADLTGQADKVGISSLAVNLLRDEIKLLEDVNNVLGKEKEQLTVELTGPERPARITVLQPADAPEAPSQMVRLSLTAFAILVGFFLPVGIIVWRDASAQRINSSADVPRELGLDVFGVVPLVPTRAVRQIASTDNRQSGWRTLICESVDGIAARLLHVAEFERTQVVLVSSAVGGEGKTVLATQLAMSLARTGHRTVLVDFDLRRPAIDKVFKLPLGPGVCEVLRSEAALPEAIQETSPPNLSVMTAGTWGPKLLKVLAGGLQDSLFAALRKQYDFVVVDGCPILPVADARFVSQHVDAVILAVLRDVSRAPKIRTACRILAGLGVRILGAVVAESAAGVDYHDSRYHARRDAAAAAASES